MEMEIVMQYPVVIHKDKKSDYGVTVPDLPGCFAAGATIDEALVMAREAIELHIEGLIEEGMAVPDPSSIDRLRKKTQYAGGVWAVVDINPSKLRKDSKRVNITLPQRVLDSIDRFASSHGETRSGLLTKAVANYISERKKSA